MEQVRRARLSIQIIGRWRWGSERNRAAKEDHGRAGNLWPSNSNLMWIWAGGGKHTKLQKGACGKLPDDYVWVGLKSATKDAHGRQLQPTRAQRRRGKNGIIASALLTRAPAALDDDGGGGTAAPPSAPVTVGARTRALPNIDKQPEGGGHPEPTSNGAGGWWWYGGGLCPVPVNLQIIPRVRLCAVRCYARLLPDVCIFRGAGVWIPMFGHMPRQFVVEPPC